MIVTTSQLYVLKTGLGLREFQNAKTIDDVAVRVRALVVSKDNGPELDREIATKIAKLHGDIPEIETRLIQLAEITKKDTQVLGPTWSFDHAVRFAPQNILVVSYDALAQTLRKIRRIVLAAGRRRKRVGMLQRDLSTRTKWIEAISKKASTS